jgi:hypothetical protein
VKKLRQIFCFVVQRLDACSDYVLSNRSGSAEIKMRENADAEQDIDAYQVL